MEQDMINPKGAHGNIEAPYGYFRYRNQGKYLF